MPQRDQHLAEPGEVPAPKTSELERLREICAEQTQRAREAERKLAAITASLERLPIGVLVADIPTARTIFANDAMNRLAAMPPGAGELHPDAQAWRGVSADGQEIGYEALPLHLVLAKGEAEAETKARFEGGDGERRWLRLIGKGVPDTGQEAGGPSQWAVMAVLDVDREHRQGEEQAILVEELDHRVKNVFATMIALVNRSLRGTPEQREAASRIEDRIHAYAHSHALLTHANWSGSTLGDVARVTLSPHIAEGRVIVDGPPIAVGAKVALSLSMAFHELLTNATKYGALSTEGGRVGLAWRPGASSDGYVLEWRETGGPPVEPPQSEGFGSFITRDVIAMETDGSVKIDYLPGGVVWTLST